MTLIFGQLSELVRPATRETEPDISAITNYLYLAAHPQDGHVETIEKLGITLILNMIWHRPAGALAKPPYRMVTLRTFDAPRLLIPVSTLQRGVEEALPVIREGGKVLVYCREGRHRSVAMAACILIAMGYSPDAAMELIVQQRPIADPHAPHIEQQIRAFAASWNSAAPG